MGAGNGRVMELYMDERRVAGGRRERRVRV